MGYFERSLEIRQQTGGLFCLFEKLVSAGWWYMSLISALERFEANLVWVFFFFFFGFSRQGLCVALEPVLELAL